jgi:hypothetical protein
MERRNYGKICHDEGQAESLEEGSASQCQKEKEKAPQKEAISNLCPKRRR